MAGDLVMDIHLVCDTQPLCLCLDWPVDGPIDDHAPYECECTGNVTGFSKEKCENCGAPMVETTDE